LAPVHVEWPAVTVGRVRAPILVLLGGVAGLVMVLVLIAFRADEAAHHGRVARNVTVGGLDVSGYSPSRLAGALEEVDRRHATTVIVIAVDDGETISTDAGHVGLRVNPAATSANVLAVGRAGSGPARWMSWLRGFASTRTADIAVSVDRPVLDAAVAGWSERTQQPMVEARIGIGTRGRFDGRFVGLPGQPGRGLRADGLERDLAAAAGRGAPVKVTAVRDALQPRFSEADAEEAAARAEVLVAVNLPLVVETTTASLSSAAMRPLVTSRPGRDRLELVVDETKAAEVAAGALRDAGPAPKEPTFNIGADGIPVLVPGARGKVCCSPAAGPAVAAAIVKRPEGPIRLELVERGPNASDEAAAASGVKELVSTFSTRHPAGQPRVTNIHRMADLVRGQVIPPGGTFSVNGFIGQRTLGKGFVVDHAIAEGEFVEDVGGGVSQFATTLFNAAWFGGLEFGEYQSHTLYISRYPRGRDATLGFPHPDLVIVNPSPYGVLIWPTYTDKEITVALYSTKWVNVEAVGQSKVKVGSCTAYINKRKRTFLDGRVVEDSTRARYRAARGQDCGESEPSLATTTTTKRR
jgi:vancomycin resistance protein YoaR